METPSRCPITPPVPSSSSSTLEPTPPAAPSKPAASAIPSTNLRRPGAIILGISRDTVQAQKKFAEKFQLKYPLLADPDEKICNYFGVIQPKNMYGKLVKGVQRNTYLIAAADMEGKQRLRHVWTKVKPEGHAEEVLDFLKSD